MLKEMILNSEACFKGILDYVQEEGNKHPIDEVEKKLFGKLLKLGQGLRYACPSLCLPCILQGKARYPLIMKLEQLIG